MKIVKFAHSSHSKDEDFRVKNRVLGMGFKYDEEDGFLKPCQSSISTTVVFTGSKRVEFPMGEDGVNLNTKINTQYFRSPNSNSSLIIIIIKKINI